MLSRKKPRKPPTPNPTFVRNGYDLLGGYNKAKLLSLMHLDPLFGAEFPVHNLSRELIELEEEADLEVSELKYSDHDWEDYIMRYDTSITYGLTIGLVVGVSTAIAKTFGNVLIAAAGVVVLPVSMGQRKITMTMAQYARYGLKSMFNKGDRSWFRLTTVADKIGIPKSEPAVRTGPVYKEAQKQFLKELRGNKEYYTKEAAKEVRMALFAPFYTRLNGQDFFRQICINLTKWINNHPLKLMANEYRLENRILPDAYIPYTQRLNHLGKWLFPKRRYIHAFLRFYVLWFHRQVRKNVIWGPYFFIILSFHLYFWQHFAILYINKKAGELKKGYFITAALITGSWNFWWFMGSLYGRAPFLTIPWKHVPGAFIGYYGLSNIINYWLLSWESRSMEDFILARPNEDKYRTPVVIPYEQVFKDYIKMVKERDQQLKKYFESDTKEPFVRPTISQMTLDMANKYDACFRMNSEVLVELQELIEEVRSEMKEGIEEEDRTGHRDLIYFPYRDK